MKRDVNEVKRGKEHTGVGWVGVYVCVSWEKEFGSGFSEYL